MYYSLHKVEDELSYNTLPHRMTERSSFPNAHQFQYFTLSFHYWWKNSFITKCSKGILTSTRPSLICSHRLDPSFNELILYTSYGNTAVISGSTKSLLNVTQKFQLPIFLHYFISITNLPPLFYDRSTNENYFLRVWILSRHLRLAHFSSELILLLL